MSLTCCTYLFLCVKMSHYAPMGIKHPRWYREMHYVVRQKAWHDATVDLSRNFLLLTWGLLLTNTHTHRAQNVQVQLMGTLWLWIWRIEHIKKKIMTKLVLKPNSVFTVPPPPRNTWRGPQTSKLWKQWAWWWPLCLKHADETETERKHSPIVLTVGGIREVGFMGGDAHTHTHTQNTLMQ